MSCIRQENTENYSIYNGDCVEVMKSLPSNSIDLSVYSPPFSDLFTYSDHIADMGNTANYDEFFKQYKYAIKELFRITRDKRLTVIHCKDLPLFKWKDGFVGMQDFSGDIIKAYQEEGWIYHSRVTIWKDPVVEMQRTKAQKLLYKELCKDSTTSAQAAADYLIIMRKPILDESNIVPVQSGESERFYDYVGSSMYAPAQQEINKGRTQEEKERLYSISVWQRYASPVWFDINQSNCLNVRRAKDEKDEKHMCPLQLDVIERAIELWSNPNEIVFTPFMGIGSEVYSAIKMGRKGVGVELKSSYYDVAVENIKSAVKNKASLFDDMPEM